MYNQQIETFISVATFGSFSKAAEALFISPTAVMKQINSLEGRLGVTLFARTNHGLVLTSAGKSLFQDAKYLVDYSIRAIEKAKAIDERENIKSIRIGTSIMTPVKFLLDIWSEIQHFCPTLKIELVPFENTPENAREILKNLGHQIDAVAGMYTERMQKESGFLVQHLSIKKILLAVPITNPLASKEIICMDDLKGTNVLLIAKGWDKVFDRMHDDLTSLGIKVHDFEFFNVYAFNQAVKNNMLIMAIDGWDNIHPLLKIIPVEWNYDIAFGLMHSSTPTKEVKQFVDQIKKMPSLQDSQAII